MKFLQVVIILCLVGWSALAVAGKEELYLQADINRELERLKNLAVECKFQHELVTIYPEFEISKPIGDGYQALDKNGRQIFGKVNSTTGNLENRSTSQCSVMFYKDRSVCENIDATHKMRSCYIFNVKTDQVTHRQWIDWNTDNPKVFPQEQNILLYNYIPFNGWGYLEGSASTFFAENNTLLKDTGDHFLLGPKDNATMRFTFKKGKVPLRTNVTFDFPGTEKQVATFDDFVPFEGIELPTSYTDTREEKGLCIHIKKVTNMKWRVITPSEFNERFTAIQKEVTEEPKNTLPITIINADDLK